MHAKPFIVNFFNDIIFKTNLCHILINLVYKKATFQARCSLSKSWGFFMSHLLRPGTHTKTPRWGLKIGCNCPTLGQHQNCFFPVNKLQILYSWDICNNLIKTHEAPYANCSATSYNHYSPVIIIIAKKITLIRLISMTEL